MLFSVNSIVAQFCETNVYAVNDTIACNDSTLIIFGATGGSENFNCLLPNGSLGPCDPAWAVNPGVDFSQPYLPSPDGNGYLWMGNTISGAAPPTGSNQPRTVTSPPYDASCGGQICFDFVFANQGGTSPIEGPDEYDEGLSLQYKLSSGGWVDIKYWAPNGDTLISNPGTSTPNSGTNGPFTTWQDDVCVAIPAAAQVANVIFRFAQIPPLGDSGFDYDHWGIDDISVSINSTAADIYMVSPVAMYIGTTPDTIKVGPTDSTLYVFDLDYGSIILQDSVTVYLEETNAGPDVTLDCNTNIVQLQASGILPIGNYNWSPPTGLSNPNIINPTASPLDTTDYIFTSACGVDTVTVNVIANYSFSASDDTAICVGDSAYLQVYGGAESFAWSPNDGSISDTTLRAPIFTPSVTTTYTVFSDSAGCIKSDTMTIYVSNKQFVFVAATDADCNGNNNGTLQSIASGGLNTPYNYELRLNGVFVSNQITGFYNALESGTYTITVNDSMASCPVDTTVMIGGGVSVNIDSIYSENPLCVGDTSGRIEIFTDTNLVANYSIDGGLNTQTSNIFTGISDGIYNISVQYGSCPPTTAIDTLSAPATIDILFEDSIDLTCFGSADGQIHVSANMGVQPYTFSLDNNVFQSDSFFTNLTAGSYAIYAMDNNGCRDSLVTSVSEPAAMLVNNININPVICFGDSSGSISFNAINGTAPYQYSIDSGLNFQSSNNFNNLPQGAYVLQVTDVNGCFSNLVHDTITEPTDLTLILDSTISSTCGAADGSISVIANGGTGTYSFSIDTGLNNQALPSFDNLTAGIYNIIVTDGNACSESLDVSVANFGAPTLTIASFDSVLCNGNSTATVQLSATGGTLPYNFSVDGGIVQSDSLFTNLNAGLHNFTVEDANSCQGTVAITIYEPSLLGLSTTTDSTSCSGNNDGEINISETGGTAPYVYAINDTSTAQISNNFTGYAPGVYTAYVVDVNGCLASTATEVYQGDNVQIDAVTVVDATCNANSDAQITISASGGGSIYTYAVNDTNSLQVTNIFTGLPAGIDTAYVLDENGCFAFAPFTVQEPDTLIITNVNPVDISCNNDGTFTIDAQGGTAPYTYTLNGGSAQTSNIFTITTAGTYTLGVTDANLCDTAKMTSTIVAPNAVTYTVDTATASLVCNNENFGLIGIAAQGGSAPYQYSIDNGVNFQVDSFFTNLAAGSYNVIVRDAFGCLAAAATNVVIVEPTAISGNSFSTSVSCNGNTDGTLTVNNISGGTPPYMVEVNGLSSPYTTSLNFANLAAGIYAINVTDDNNCTYTWNETVQDVGAIALNASSPINVSCFGAADGEINVAATGGTPNYDFTISLGSFTETVNSNTNAVFSNLEGTEAGLVYTISIEDANGCTGSLTQTITQPNQLIITGIDTSALTCFGAEDASMSVNASGGSAPYTYIWSPDIMLANQVQNTIFGLSSGVYLVDVTDANNCTVSASQTILDVAPVLANISPDSALISMGDTLQLGVNVQNAIGTNLQYSWSPTTGLSCSDCANPSVTSYNDVEYSVVVTDENGCNSFNYSEVFITVDQTLFYFIPNGFSPNGDGVNDVFSVLGQDIQSVSTQIFNNWGQMIFNGTNQFTSWDGTYQGVGQPSGSYVYMINITFLNGTTVNETGSITLLR